MEQRRRNVIISDAFRTVMVGGGSAESTNRGDQLLSKDSTFSLLRTPDGEQKIIIKGSGIKGGDGLDFSISLNKVRQTLQELKKNKHLLIKKLSGPVKDNFDNMIEILNLMRENSAYSYIHDIIVEVFDDKTEVTPGTIGAHFAGCRVATSGFNGNNNCVAICAGSVRKDANEAGCEHQSMLYDGDQTFTTLNDSPSRKNVYIFIPAEKGFKGFTKEALDKLKTFGVEKAAIILHSRDGTQYVEKMKDFVPIESLGLSGTRQTAPASGQPVVVQSSSNTALIIILVILLIVIIIGAWWYMSRGKGSF